jgi:hypothetical protein
MLNNITEHQGKHYLLTEAREHVNFVELIECFVALMAWRTPDS